MSVAQLINLSMFLGTTKAYLSDIVQDGSYARK